MEIYQQANYANSNKRINTLLNLQGHQDVAHAQGMEPAASMPYVKLFSLQNQSENANVSVVSNLCV